MAEVYYKNDLAGYLTEHDQGYIFQYTEEYVQASPMRFISFSFPVTSKPFHNKTLFPFFEGLIPEGWLLDIASRNWKINPNDRMGLLLACCHDCIGAVSVKPTLKTS